MFELKGSSSYGGVGNNLKLYESGSETDTAALNGQRAVTPLTVKRCTCARGNCPSHVDKDIPAPPPPPPVKKIPRPRTGGPNAMRLAAVNSNPVIPFNHRDELKLSLSSLATESERPTEADVATIDEKEAMFTRWLQEKEEARRRLERERSLLEHAIIAEKQRKIELERRNYESWLETKRHKERDRKEQEAKEVAERKKIVEQAQERKKLENDLSYSLWLRRAEERKLQDQLRVETDRLKEAERRRQRLEMNATAYERWLTEAKHKPRPIPMNRGLDSLRASVSVSYVNPTPWEPNVKPTTQ